MKKIRITKIPYFDKIIITLIVFISILFWNSILIFPIKLFVVLLHEISHGIIGIITGGEIKNIEVNLSLGGNCKISGGNSILIAFSGYIGSLIWGSLLFIFANNKKKLIIFTTTFAIILLYFAANYIIGATGIIFSLIYIAVLLVLPRYFSFNFNKILFSSIGLISCLYVVFDIKEDIFVSEFRITDAQILSEKVGLSPLFWGFIWLVLAIVIIYLLIKNYLLNKYNN